LAGTPAPPARNRHTQQGGRRRGKGRQRLLLRPGPGHRICRARREAIVGVDQEGSKVTDLFVREGDIVTENQELARLTAPPANPQNPGAKPGQVTLRAPAAGLVTEVHTIVGAPASPQAGPMFRIAVNNEIELDAEVPGIHMLKLNPGATTRISRDGTPDLIGRVRLVLPENQPQHATGPCPHLARQ